MYIKDLMDDWGSYQGSQKRPLDFDQFWKESKLEVDQLGLSYRLERHELYSNVAEAFDLIFWGVDGAEVHAQFVKPIKVDGKIPMILQFHGYHTNSGDWTDKIGYAAEGYASLSLDVRGQGGLSQDNTQTKGGTLKGHIIRGVDEGKENLLFRKVFQDIYQLTQIAFSMEFIDTEKIYATGASQGGAQAIVCAALKPEIKKVFVCYPFLSDYREAYRLDVNNSAYEEIAYWFRFRDPLHEKEEKLFSVLDYIDIQYFASLIEAEVIWAMGLEDRVCHPKTQFATYNQINSQKELIILPEYGHEYLPKFGEIIRKKLYEDRG
ncbi:acetylxylan esterase [Globicatella sulfidifaciens]|uniref:Cephalosporin-C deacetylase n=1 Tax=Globicatella sulfidifaciens DSM 15739 TaxID=1121925 RepID=A0A1T4MUH7_9LACT|nr:acetylxylan esterase [Globicatella sulfidifaciens]SJZ70642.1 cephalosporin-C deacetylase [Globicatella sulfidifaciens DSM 15739]